MPNMKQHQPANKNHQSVKSTKEKPFTKRVQNLLKGKPQEEVILDPDNPNLIKERFQD